jgi:hypothetical protein
MMKKWSKIGGAIVLFLFPALLIALCAYGLGMQTDRQEFRFGAENEFCSEGDDPEVTIRHCELDAGNENVEFFYEIPHMEGITPTAKHFNDFFEALYADFMATDPKEVRELLDATVPGRPSAEDPFRYCWRAEVQEVSERWISVTLSYDWYMGGVWDYGIDGYTFDRHAGERLFLDDVLPGSEEMIQAAIADGLKEQYPDIVELEDGQGNTPVTVAAALPVRMIDFYVAEGGTVTVVFDKYEIAPGAVGLLTVKVEGLPSSA